MGNTLLNDRDRDEILTGEGQLSMNAGSPVKIMERNDKIYQTMT